MIAAGWAQVYQACNVGISTGSIAWEVPGNLSGQSLPVTGMTTCTQSLTLRYSQGCSGAFTDLSASLA